MITSEVTVVQAPAKSSGMYTAEGYFTTDRAANVISDVVKCGMGAAAWYAPKLSPAAKVQAALTLAEGTIGLLGSIATPDDATNRAVHDAAGLLQPLSKLSAGAAYALSRDVEFSFAIAELTSVLLDLANPNPVVRVLARTRLPAAVERAREAMKTVKDRQDRERLDKGFERAGRGEGGIIFDDARSTRPPAGMGDIRGDIAYA